MKKVVVIGSLNVDETVLLDHIPLTGETLTAGKVSKSFGGKGANQAVALKKLGCDVRLLGAVGDDEKGLAYREYLSGLQFDLGYILTKNDVYTGNAFICLDEAGNNTIVVNPGANGVISIEDIQKNDEIFNDADACLMQLEIPMDIVALAADTCKSKGIPVFLNPAPVNGPLPEDLLHNVEFIVPNETELKKLSGMDGNDFEGMAGKLISSGARRVLVTLGSEGSMYCDENTCFVVPAVKTAAIDTTAAGDSYIGAFISAFSGEESIRDAMQFASRVASITVSKRGASDSIPSLDELEER